MPNHTHVGNEGSPTAPLVLIGEAPGTWEMEYGRPFVGPSYNDKLLPWWRECQPALDRSMFFITNVLDFQPQHIDRVGEHEVRKGMDRLHETIASLPGDGPRVLCPQGNYALYALTGKGKVSFHNKDGRHERPGIKDWRGSILEYEDRKGRRFKVIPNVHPAATFYKEPWLEKPIRATWQRVATDMEFRELRLPQRTHIVMPSKAEAIEWLRWTRAEAAKQAALWDAEVAKHGAAHLLTLPWHAVPRRLALSCDVETPYKIDYTIKEGVSASEAPGTKCRMCGHSRRWHVAGKVLDDGTGACAGPHAKGCGHSCGVFQPPLLKPKRVKTHEEAYLGCSGYSWDPAIAICIPTTLQFWQDPAVLAEIEREMAITHSDPNIDKIGQNYGFDQWWYAVRRMTVLGGKIYDLMKMHRVRCPADGAHDLAYQASLYTRQPFWKHEAKDPESISKFANNSAALFDYNCIDNGVQRQLAPIHWDALLEAGRLEYYLEMEAPMDEALPELSRTGIRADEPGRKAEYDITSAQALEMGVQINAAAGCELVGKKAVGNERLKKFLYGDGLAKAVYERPEIEVTSAAAKCVTCSHLKKTHDHDPNHPIEAQPIGACLTRRRPACACTQFVAPKKLGKRVKVGETHSGGLRLPVQYKKVADKENPGRKKKSISVDIVTIRRLMEQFPMNAKLQEVGRLVLRHRRLLKVAGSLSESKVSPDGRVYGLFKQDTLLGRLSCEAPPSGNGDNLQNQDRKLRRFYLPDRDVEAA